MTNTYKQFNELLHKIIASGEENEDILSQLLENCDISDLYCLDALLGKYFDEMQTKSEAEDFTPLREEFGSAIDQSISNGFEPS